MAIYLSQGLRTIRTSAIITTRTRASACAFSLPMCAVERKLDTSSLASWQWGAAVLAAGLAGGVGEGRRSWQCEGAADNPGIAVEQDALLTNWSGTHEVTVGRLYTPKSEAELEVIIAKAHADGKQLRPVGKFLSPNGIAAAAGGMVSLAELDQVLRVDVERSEIIVQAGVLVETVLETLASHGLTLANFSSIKDQQMGGWMQVAAHGTGATLPTVDEMITRMRLVTPGRGTLELSDACDPELFRMARCGLGALGVVTEMTLKCVPAHRLHERSFTSTVAELRGRGPRNHATLLKRFRHVRFMWIPFTETVVVVVSNPEGTDDHGYDVLDAVHESELLPSPLEPMRRLLMETPGAAVPGEDINKLAIAGLRDRLLDFAPLDKTHVAKVNRAEAQFWAKASGERIGWSNDVLGFDCGGQQWVVEVCFPVGTLDEPNGKDLDFVADVREAILARGLPAPSPIEQRWTASSSSPMSPAYSKDPNAIFSWVGVIMYLPPGQDENARENIGRRFKEYSDVLHYVGKRYGAQVHWAKIELPPAHWSSERRAQRIDEMRNMLQRRYDVKAFNRARNSLDPKHILSNDLISELFDE